MAKRTRAPKPINLARKSLWPRSSFKRNCVGTWAYASACLVNRKYRRRWLFYGRIDTCSVPLWFFVNVAPRQLTQTAAFYGAFRPPVYQFESADLWVGSALGKRDTRVYKQTVQTFVLIEEYHTLFFNLGVPNWKWDFLLFSFAIDYFLISSQFFHVKF